jgi:Ricin-type beta-trefoil lectin domain-like
VTEINSKSNNLNQGFKAESVSSAISEPHQFIFFAYQFRSACWLVSHYTSAPSAASTTFDVWIQTRVKDKYLDLSQGIGRERRYIVPVVSPAGREKVTDVALFRSQSPISRPPEGYSGVSRNINHGRGSDHLYIVWKAVPFEPTQILDGVYIIRNKASNTALDLFEGKADNCTRVHGCAAVPMEKDYFNQNWWIERIRGRSQYSVRNVRTNTCLEVAQGSSENGAQVQGHHRNEGAAQEWDIIGNDEAGYRYA